MTLNQNGFCIAESTRSTPRAANQSAASDLSCWFSSRPVFDGSSMDHSSGLAWVNPSGASSLVNGIPVSKT